MLRAVMVTTVLVAVAATGCSSTDEPRAVPTTVTPTVPATPTPTSTPTPSAAEARRLGLEAVAALKRDDPDRALALIARGADVNAQDDIQDSVFLFAGAEGYTAVVRAALKRGADVTSTNRYGGTALIPASEHAHLDVIRILIAAGTPIDHVNELGWTALGEAVGLGDGGTRAQQAVRLLLAAGADPRVRDRFDRTVLQNAERLGYDEIADLLRAALQSSGS